MNEIKQTIGRVSTNGSLLVNGSPHSLARELGDHSMLSPLFSVLATLLIVSSLLGNGFVAVHRGGRRSMSTFHLLVRNLAAADFLHSLINGLYHLWQVTSFGGFELNGNGILCQLLTCVSQFLEVEQLTICLCLCLDCSGVFYSLCRGLAMGTVGVSWCVSLALSVSLVIVTLTTFSTSCPWGHGHIYFRWVHALLTALLSLVAGVIVTWKCRQWRPFRLVFNTPPWDSITTFEMCQCKTVSNSCPSDETPYNSSGALSSARPNRTSSPRTSMKRNNKKKIKKKNTERNTDEFHQSRVTINISRQEQLGQSRLLQTTVNELYTATGFPGDRHASGSGDVEEEGCPNSLNSFESGREKPVMVSQQTKVPCRQLQQQKSSADVCRRSRKHSSTEQSLSESRSKTKMAALNAVGALVAMATTPASSHDRRPSGDSNNNAGTKMTMGSREDEDQQQQQQQQCWHTELHEAAQAWLSFYGIQDAPPNFMAPADMVGVNSTSEHRLKDDDDQVSLSVVALSSGTSTSTSRLPLNDGAHHADVLLKTTTGTCEGDRPCDDGEEGEAILDEDTARLSSAVSSKAIRHNRSSPSYHIDNIRGSSDSQQLNAVQLVTATSRCVTVTEESGENPHICLKGDEMGQNSKTTRISEGSVHGTPLGALNEHVFGKHSQMASVERKTGLSASLQTLWHGIRAKYPEDAQEGERLRQDGERLQENSQWLQQDGEWLQQDGQRLQQDGKQLQQDGQQLQQDGQRLQQDGQRLQQDGQWLQQDGQWLQQDGQRLQQDGQWLQQDGQRLQQDGQWLQQDGERLQQDGQWSQQDGERLQQDGQQLQQDGEQLQQDGQWSQQEASEEVKSFDVEALINYHSTPSPFRSHASWRRDDSTKRNTTENNKTFALTTSDSYSETLHSDVPFCIDIQMEEEEEEVLAGENTDSFDTDERYFNKAQNALSNNKTPIGSSSRRHLLNRRTDFDIIRTAHRKDQWSTGSLAHPALSEPGDLRSGCAHHEYLRSPTRSYDFPRITKPAISGCGGVGGVVRPLRTPHPRLSLHSLSVKTFFSMSIGHRALLAEIGLYDDILEGNVLLNPALISRLGSEVMDCPICRDRERRWSKDSNNSNKRQTTDYSCHASHGRGDPEHEAGGRGDQRDVTCHAREQDPSKTKKQQSNFVGDLDLLSQHSRRLHFAAVLIVVVWQLVCWLPLAVFRLLQDYRTNLVPTDTLLAMGALRMTVQPLLYLAICRRLPIPVPGLLDPSR